MDSAFSGVVRDACGVVCTIRACLLGFLLLVGHINVCPLHAWGRMGDDLLRAHFTEWLGLDRLIAEALPHRSRPHRQAFGDGHVEVVGLVVQYRGLPVVPGRLHGLAGVEGVEEAWGGGEEGGHTCARREAAAPREHRV